jgi:hypothetical protein
MLAAGCWVAKLQDLGVQRPLSSMSEKAFLRPIPTAPIKNFGLKWFFSDEMGDFGHDMYV